MKSCISLAAILAAITFCGCSQQPSSSPENSASSETTAVPATINTNCPVMGSPVTDDGGRYDWNGKNVGFCCPECIEAFAEMSDEEKATAIADADSSAADDTKPHAHDHGDEHEEPEAS